MAIKLGLCDSPKKFAAEIANEVTVPQSCQIVDFSTGVLNEGQENELVYASLTAVDLDLYKKFKSINQEVYCPNFKMKLRGYSGEDLSSLLGKTLSFSNYDVAFIFDKFKQPVGLALVVELKDITIQKLSAKDEMTK